ncbi:MAG: TraB/GumN family protein [Saprospiraceae bacterium]
MSLKKYIFTLFIIGFIIISNGCSTSKKVVGDTFTNALLWEVSGKDLSNPSFVFGTIHLIPSKDFFYPSGFMTSFEKTKSVYFEIDMEDMSDMSKVMTILPQLMMKDDISLKDLLSETDYNLVDNYFQKLGFPVMLLEKMKPMFLSAFLEMDMDPNGLKNGDLKSYEMEIYEMAQSTNKNVGGLESMEFQLSLFDDIPYKTQAQMLVDGIKNKTTEQEDSALIDLVKIYKSQDIEAMVALMAEDKDTPQDVQDKLLVNRNQNWIPLIIDHARKQPSFFAVGAGHLGGKTGVIQLLKDNGYTVKPVK